MKTFRFLFSFLFFAILSPAVFSQTSIEKRISVDFDEVYFSQFIRDVEGQTGYFFYYQPHTFDSLKVTLHVKDQPLTSVLEQVFKSSDFRYAIDHDQKRIFLTEGQAIITQLADDLFEPLDTTEQASSNAKKRPTVAAYVPPTNEVQEKRLSTAENKLHEIGVRTMKIKEGKSTLTGYVRNAVTGEPVIGAAVYIETPKIGTTTDALGNYSLSIPRGSHTLKIKSVGMKETQRQIILYSDGKLEIELRESVIALKEVLVKAGKDVNVTGSQMGLERLDIKTMKQVPTAFGETDLFRVVLTLPGVKSVGESSTGLNVRGGSTDQNLILFNDAVVFNPSHLFGFFSAFNPDVVKNLELYKSNIPIKYGGRLSSVLDINGRDGNKKKFAASGGIGLITGRLTLEGPIIKDKTSFIIGGRTTYSDWLLKSLDNATFNKSSASFYDLNVHVNHEINKKNSLFLTGYVSSDKFRLNSGDTLYSYQNQLGSLKWKHTFSQKLLGVFTAAYSRYQYAIAGHQTPTTAYDLSFGIRQANLNADFNYFIHPKHSLDFGFNTINYKVSPGSFTPSGVESLIKPIVLENEQAQESAIYVGDKFDINQRLSLTVGFRYSFFQYLGPHKVYSYAPGLPMEKAYSTGSQLYPSGELIKTYGGPEYRLSARYMLSENASVKASYNRTRQYLHLLTNTTAISPTDIWKLSDSHIKPQVGDQYALGFYKNLKNNTLEFSAEVYYKNIYNFLDYKAGDSLILNSQIETAVITTHGKAYGLELMLNVSPADSYTSCS
ncbi:MAG: TonB-dependent receptor, partial [Bacteroidota bacterium]